jgi:hypothetical protein
MQDKTISTHLTAMLENTQTLRSLGATDFCLQHGVWDGALAKPMAERLAQVVAADLAQVTSAMSIGQRKMMELMTWTEGTGCMGHNVHVGFGWAMQLKHLSPDIPKNCYIAIESLRNTYADLSKYLPMWVPTVLEYRDWDFPDAHVLWNCLGLPPKIVDLLLTLQIRFLDGRLFIAERFRHDSDRFNLIATVLLAVFKWRTWSDSRWVVLGESSRSLVASLVVGLRGLVTFVRTQTPVTEDKIHGFDRLREDELKLMGVASVSSWAADNALMHLMTDDRLPLVVHEIENDLNEEVEFVSLIPENVWRLLGQVLQCPHRGLQADCIKAVHTSVGFIRERFRKAKRLPWTLAVGDLDDNLDKLQAGPAPSNITAQKIKQLDAVGFDRDRLKDAIALFKRPGWITLPCEQGHTAAQTLMRYHRMYCQNTVRARSFLVLCRPLFAVPREQRRVDNLEKRLDSMLRCRVAGLTGRQAFVTDLCGLLQQQRASGNDVPSDANKRVFKGHGVRWDAMDLPRKQYYELQAEELRHLKRLKIHDDVTAVKDDLNVARSTLRIVVDRSGPFRMSVCAASPEDRQRFLALWSSPAFQPSAVAQLRTAVLDDVTPSSSDYLATLDSFIIREEQAPKPMLLWLGRVCRLRQHFSDSIWRFEDGDNYKYGKFLYALQNPLGICWVEVSPREVETEDVRPAAYGAYVAQSWEFAFDYIPNAYRFSDEVGWATEQASVMCHVADLGGMRLGSDSPFRMLDTILALLPNPAGAAAAHRDADRPPRHALIGPDVLRDHPWILDHLKKRKMIEGKQRSVHGGSEDDDDARDAGEDVDGADHRDFDIDDVFAELHAKRDMLGILVPEREVFGWSVRGGPWCFEQHGVAYDSFRAKALTEEAVDFCRLFALPLSATFSVARYTEEACIKMCAYWVARMMHFWTIYESEDCDPAYVYTLDDISSFVEQDEFRALVAEGSDVVIGRCETLRAIRPHV